MSVTTLVLEDANAWTVKLTENGIINGRLLVVREKIEKSSEYCMGCSPAVLKTNSTCEFSPAPSVAFVGVTLQKARFAYLQLLWLEVISQR